MSTIFQLKRQQTIPHVYKERPGCPPRSGRMVGQSIDLNRILNHVARVHLKLPCALDTSAILAWLSMSIDLLYWDSGLMECNKVQWNKRLSIGYSHPTQDSILEFSKGFFSYVTIYGPLWVLEGPNLYRKCIYYQFVCNFVQVLNFNVYALTIRQLCSVCSVLSRVKVESGHLFMVQDLEPVF